MAPRKSQSKDAAVTSGVVNKPKQAEKTNTPQGTKRKRFDWTNAEFGGFALKPVKISKETSARPRSLGTKQSLATQTSSKKMCSGPASAQPSSGCLQNPNGRVLRGTGDLPVRSARQLSPAVC